jgi:energy-coupling factor transporter ATP-binding protein EcfA2/succinate dehydrogenase flavin-adding protein (antitoxin of CptAB toxin-antitoxin module)
MSYSGTTPEELQQRLEAFRAANQNLRLQPLKTSDELNRLWVEYDTPLLEELEQRVEDSLEAEKFLFTGHTGCGKSTLLSELRFRLAPRYFVVMFAISDLMGLSNVDYVNILFSVATQLMETAEEQAIDIQPSVKKLFYRWFGKYTKVETEQIEASLGSGVEASGGLAHLFAKFWATVKADLKINSVTREEIKTEFAPKISELIDRINEIASAIEAGCDRPILVVIDDLDKLSPELTDKVYRNHATSLFQPSFRIIYTIPIFALRDVSLRNILRTHTGKIQTMHVAKFFAKGDHQPDAQPINPGMIETFRQILNQRISPDLMEPEVQQQLILKSGGVLRELIRLASRCCDKCSQRLRRGLRNPETIASILIDQEVLNLALTDLQIEFAEPLGQVDYDLLKTIYEQNTPPDAENQRFLDLLHGLYILEYRNAQLWYDLHPIVVDLLRVEEMLA